MKYLLITLILSLGFLSTAYSFKKNISSLSKVDHSNFKKIEKCYGTVIDAADSYTKVNVYCWNCRDTV